MIQTRNGLRRGVYLGLAGAIACSGVAGANIIKALKKDGSTFVHSASKDLSKGEKAAGTEISKADGTLVHDEKAAARLFSDQSFQSVKQAAIKNYGKAVKDGNSLYQKATADAKHLLTDAYLSYLVEQGKRDYARDKPEVDALVKSWLALQKDKNATAAIQRILSRAADKKFDAGMVQDVTLINNLLIAGTTALLSEPAVDKFALKEGGQPQVVDGQPPARYAFASAGKVPWASFALTVGIAAGIVFGGDTNIGATWDPNHPSSVQGLYSLGGTGGGQADVDGTILFSFSKQTIDTGGECGFSGGLAFYGGAGGSIQWNLVGEQITNLNLPTYSAGAQVGIGFSLVATAGYEWVF